MCWRTLVVGWGSDCGCDVVVPQARLPPEVNRALYVRNLPYKITAEEMYDIFGKYGSIRQIRKSVWSWLWPGVCLHACAWCLSHCLLRAGAHHPCGCYCVRLFSPHIHRGVTSTTKGTAFVVYDDIYDAKNAVDHLSGFNVCGRYLIVLYYQPKRAAAKREVEKERAELEALKKKYGVVTDAEEEKRKRQ